MKKLGVLILVLLATIAAVFALSNLKITTSDLRQINTDYTLCQKGCVNDRTVSYNACKHDFSDEYNNCKNNYNSCINAGKNKSRSFNRTFCISTFSECKKEKNLVLKNCTNSYNEEYKNCRGNCTQKKNFCTKIYSPVCGSDGKVYGNECLLNNTNVSKRCEGICPCPRICKNDEACGPYEYCNFANCDEIGTCTNITNICTDEYSPVCGCDGKTYSNDCTLKRFAISISHDGACRNETCTSDDDCPVIECFKAPCPEFSCIQGKCVGHTCGNNICEPGEADYQNCPICTGKICPMIACMIRMGSCPSDCNASCKDTDNGVDYYHKGNVTFGKSKFIDSCTYCTGACPGNTNCPPIRCGAVVEHYCGPKGMQTITHVCENGCKNGACLVKNPTS